MESNVKVRVSEANPSIQRINPRCIDCGQCLNTCDAVVGLDRTKETNEPLCINCGACILKCPMGALTEKYQYKTVLNLVKDSNKCVTISVAPAVRVALGELLGREFGTSMENVLPSILKAIGFDYVFDVTFGADVTIMEEASELIRRIKNKESLPMFTSCCPAWVKYASIFHHELLPNISTTKSPIGIQSSLIKTYFKEMNGLEDDIVSVVVAPCTAKKAEVQGTDTDYSITTRELALMIKECNIDIDSLKPQDFDALLGKGSKAGLMFGRSGGVMEAALNTAYHMMTGKEPEDGMFHIDVTSPVTKKVFKMGDHIISVAVVNGIKNVREILPNLEDYDFIEVMSCEGGCVGGGGQPLGSVQDTPVRKEKRTQGLNSQEKDVLYSYQNESIKELYDSFLIEPLSSKAEKLLHTIHKEI